MPSGGIKIAPKNVEVTTATNSQLKYSSEFSYLKIYKNGSASFTTNSSGNGSVAIAHNLNYAPAFMVFRKATAYWDFFSSTQYSNCYFPVGAPNFYVLGDDTHHAIHAYADGTNLYIECKEGIANTTLYFSYIILVDKSQAFSGSSIVPASSIGFKVAKPGYDVKTAAEYNLSASSLYKAVQYKKESPKTETLSLPAMFADFFDENPEQGTYVDFEHGLGYPPLFMAFAEGTATTGNLLLKCPVWSLNSIDTFNSSINGFCDSTRVRLYFWRSSTYFGGEALDEWPSETVNIKILIFTQDLSE